MGLFDGKISVKDLDPGKRAKEVIQGAKEGNLAKMSNASDPTGLQKNASDYISSDKFNDQVLKTFKPILGGHKLSNGPRAPTPLSDAGMAQVIANQQATANSPTFGRLGGYSQNYGSMARTAEYRDLAQQAMDPLVQKYGSMADQQVNVDPAFRQYQMGLAQQLQNQAMGVGPSLAQLQLKQATDRSLQQQMGAINAGLGSNPALAARTAALAGSNQLANLGAQSGIQALQEQQAAQQALGNLATGARGQDTSQAFQQRQAQMEALGQQGAAIQTGTINPAANAFQIDTGVSINNSNQDAAAAAADRAARASERNQTVGAISTAAVPILQKVMSNNDSAGSANLVARGNKGDARKTTNSASLTGKIKGNSFV